MRRGGVLVAVALALAGCGRGGDDVVAPSVPELTAPATVAPTEPPATTEPAPATTTPPTTGTTEPPATTEAPLTTEVPATTTSRPERTTTTTDRVARPPRTTTTDAPTTTAAATTTSTSLPQPLAPPQEDGTRDPEMILGRIEIPAIGLDSELQEGIRLPTLNDGPGHWPGTAMPGELGNVVVAGHRTSHGAEFRHLDDLVPGDEVVMTTGVGRFRYLVESTEIVPPDALAVIDQRAEHTATLFACHPPGSVRERIIVHLRLAPG